MGYISLTVWRDLTDRHLYAEGDPFPHDGRAIPPARLKALETGENQAGLALIQRIEQPDEQIPVRGPETPEKPKTARKTARAKKAGAAE